MKQGRIETAVAAGHNGLALVLQGGGARAAYQVGVLKAIVELLGEPKRCPFPIITGTSAGAINAAVLASHANDFSAGVKVLAAVWSHFSPDQVYRTDLIGVARNSARWLSGLIFGAVTGGKRISLFDNSPLIDLLTEHVHPERITEHVNAGILKAVAVTASGYTSGQNCAFFQGAPELTGWQRSMRVGIRVKQLRVEHLVASAAIPFAFPAIKINREYFGDGSIRQVAPLSPALHLGAERVMVVGTAKLVKDTDVRERDDTYPSLAKIAGHAMSSIFLDTLAVDVERMLRINATLKVVDPVKLKAAGTALHHVDLLVACPDKPLEDLAHQHVRDLPWTIRFLMRSIGALRKGGATLASYLLFDYRYCRALINMGYADIMSRKDEVLDFFNPDLCLLSGDIPTIMPGMNFDDDSEDNH